MKTLSSSKKNGKWKNKSEYVSGFSFQDAVMHLDALIISTPAGSYTSKYETIEKNNNFKTYRKMFHKYIPLVAYVC